MLCNGQRDEIHGLGAPGAAYPALPCHFEQWLLLEGQVWVLPAPRILLLGVAQLQHILNRAGVALPLLDHLGVRPGEGPDLAGAMEWKAILDMVTVRIEMSTVLAGRKAVSHGVIAGDAFDSSGTCEAYVHPEGEGRERGPESAPNHQPWHEHPTEEGPGHQVLISPTGWFLHGARGQRLLRERHRRNDVAHHALEQDRDAAQGHWHVEQHRERVGGHLRTCCGKVVPDVCLHIVVCSTALLHAVDNC
mmetsp:Transcript_45169/g.98234  ORF Transcript_45169/g.98234 Transcript_45169/m.98234 type:complete len:248 (-) Transcript_45169:2681-3424(-)